MRIQKPCSLLIALLCMTSLASATTIAPFRLYDDPAGDALAGGPDLTALGSLVEPNQILFQLEFASPVAAPSALQSNSVVGYLDIDLDQDPFTGATSHQDEFFARSRLLGVEFYVDLFSEEFTPGLVELVDALTHQPVATLEVFFTGTQVTIEVPTSLLGQDVALNYGVTVGRFTGFSDEARDSGLTPATTVPEPSALALLVVATGLAGGRRGRR